MNKQQFVPQTDENRYLNTTHKCNLTGAELSTILYCLEGYIQGNDDYNSDDNFSKDIDRIFVELQSVTDNYYAQLEEINELKSLLNEWGKLTMKQTNLPQDLSFSKHELETILYSLEGYIQGNNDEELVEELDTICYKLDAILEEEN